MRSDPNPAILLLAGFVMLALEVRVVQRGTLVGKFSGVTRQTNPLAFWFIVGVNALLGVAALFLGIRGLFAA